MDPSVEILRRADELQTFCDRHIGPAPDDPDFYIRDLAQEERDDAAQKQRQVAAEAVIDRAFGVTPPDSTTGLEASRDMAETPKKPSISKRKRMVIGMGTMTTGSEACVADGILVPDQVFPHE